MMSKNPLPYLNKVFLQRTIDKFVLHSGVTYSVTMHHHSFLPHRFDCGSGTGRVRSEETIVLNQWNTITIYRHRWDAWLVLNQGNRVQGRSKVSFLEQICIHINIPLTSHIPLEIHIIVGIPPPPIPHSFLCRHPSRIPSSQLSKEKIAFCPLFTFFSFAPILLIRALFQSDLISLLLKSQQTIRFASVHAQQNETNRNRYLLDIA